MQQITIKKNLIIFHRIRDWELIKDRIKEEFGPTIFAISWRLKSELGFTVRYHHGLREMESERGRYYYVDEMHLDFYNESALSWFQLRYL